MDLVGGRVDVRAVDQLAVPAAVHARESSVEEVLLRLDEGGLRGVGAEKRDLVSVVHRQRGLAPVHFNNNLHGAQRSGGGFGQQQPVGAGP